MVRSSDDFVYRDPGHTAALCARLGQLVDEHLPAGWLAPFTNDPADLGLSTHFYEVVASEGLLVPNCPRDGRSSAIAARRLADRVADAALGTSENELNFIGQSG
jgi:hypothetical protein